MFCMVSLLASFLIYGNAFWGASLLAPLDLGPDIFTQYRFMDPEADGVPDNHYIVDQFTYDLPLQYVIYQAYQKGEIPWWDPFTYGGRPLLADAHINGTDPIRLLCNFTLPFALAYNWTYILKGLVIGLGMFLLLRHLKIEVWLALILALTYQFSGWFAAYFGHPWISGSFAYFPFLWLFWMKALGGRTAFWAGAGSLTMACIFYAGNLQSHTYPVLFGGAFLLAVFWRDFSNFWKSLAVVAFSGIVGALLAAPVLFNQVEFYLVGVRAVTTSRPYWEYLGSGLISLGAFYPWMFGTFRTLDVGKLIRASGTAYFLFCGVGVYFFALWQAFRGGRAKGSPSLAWAISIILISLYLLIVATPLSAIFYTRCAPLAGMGLVVLAALGIQSLVEKSFPHRKFAILAAGVVVFCAISSSFLALVVYPRYQDKIEQLVLSQDKENISFTSAPSLRKAQVASFPNEVSLLNPEAAITLAAAIYLFVVLISGNPLKRSSLVIILSLSAIPVFLFYGRYKPKHDIAQWETMKLGGPAQQTAMHAAGSFKRLRENPDMPLAKFVFPNALAALYGVHVVHGYSALQPVSLYLYPGSANAPPKSWIADLEGNPPIAVTSNGFARFPVNPSNEASAPSRILTESLNSVTISWDSGKSGNLIRTDTYYPGWIASTGDGYPIPVEKLAPCFSVLDFSKSLSNSTSLTLQYRPSFWNYAFVCLALGVGFSTLSMTYQFIPRKW